MRIVFAGFEHETNTFAPSKADWKAFELGGGWPGMVSGQAIFDALRGANIPAAGFIKAAQQHGHTLIPTTWCAASPSAQVTRDAYDRISALILEQIERVLPADAIYLDLHGAMVSENHDDGEGELIAQVRKRVGKNTPIVVTLDLHANMTQRMLREADALVAFRTYPHVDMADTGKRAFDYLQKIFDGQPPQHLAFRRLPFLIPICWQSTFIEPARTLYQKLEHLESSMNLASMSFCMGFPAADFPDCVGMIWAYGNSESIAQQAVQQLYEATVRVENQFNGTLYEPDQAVLKAMALAENAHKPVIVADAQDNPGAGSDSDTTGLLRALIRNKAAKAAIGLIVDAESAALAHKAGVGNTVTLRLGGKSSVPGDSPLEADFVVESLSDGRFLAKGPYYNGFNMALGPSACLSIAGIKIVVTTDKAQMADQEMFRFVGIDPRKQKILVVKSATHFRADFTPIAEAILIAVAPGSMKMDPSLLPWKHLPDDLRLLPGGLTFKELRSALQAKHANSRN